MMQFRIWRCLLCLAVVLVAGNASADETWYETKDGTTYRVTRKVQKRPVAETRMEQRTQTVYSTEFVTEMRETVRTAWVPVTDYVTQPRWHQWWNPFAEPYLAYETRPVTRWELRTQTVREPVTMQRQVPHEQIVQSPVRELGFVEQQLEERVVVTTPPVRSLPAAPEVRYAERPAPPQRPASPFRRGQPVTELTAPLRR